MSSPVQVGEVLAGKYQVEGVLGSGGMGVVVAARHLQLGERVALKFLLPQALARADVVLRFEREAQAAWRIRSEHIARVLDVGKLENGAPYLVMEYLDGNDLAALLRTDGRVPITDAVEYVLQACEALADAHALGIIHRDLKPSNLFLTQRNDGTPAIKIIDFGISKMAMTEGDVGPSSGPADMTQTAVSMGSPLYMAPEQMASARDVDARADIWSLGVILHSLLTGSVPFRGSNVMEVYELIIQGAPPLRRMRPDAPSGLEQLVRRCLQKERTDRYQSVAELAAALAEYGPPHAHLSAERTARILRARAPVKNSSPPSSAITPLDANPAPAPDVSDAGKTLAERPSSAATPPGEPPSSDALNPGSNRSATLRDPATDGAWGQRTSQPSRSRRRSLVLLGVCGAVALVVGLARFWRHGHEETTLSPASASALAGSARATSVTSGESPALPAIAPGATAPTVSVAPSLPGSAPGAAAQPPGGPSASVRAAEPRKASPKKDLFSEPR